MQSGPRACLMIAASALFLTGAGDAITGQASTSRTAWDGVYTEAQAARATAIFSDKCAECHVLAATGDGALAGEKFWEGYSQKSVGDLLTFVSANMPNGDGGSLSASSYNDLVALILKTNGFPAGTADLVPEAWPTFKSCRGTGPRSSRPTRSRASSGV